jgi:hypothetical protein
LNKNFKPIKQEEIDCAYIIHKNEGRLFLLGRNGYYNKLVEDLFPKLCKLIIYKDGRVAFILFNNPGTETDEIMEKLVFKGDQKSLQIFQNEHKFFFNTDDIFQNEIVEDEFSSLNLHFCFQQVSNIEKNFYLMDRKNYVNNIANTIDQNEKYLIKSEGPKLSSEIEEKIVTFAENYENIKSGKSNKLCFML